MNSKVEHVRPDQLPPEWIKPLGLKPGQTVRVTIEPEKPKGKFDREAIEEALKRVDALPVIDDRPVESIIEYDENGLPV